MSFHYVSGAFVSLRFPDWYRYTIRFFSQYVPVPLLFHVGAVLRVERESDRRTRLACDYLAHEGGPAYLKVSASPSPSRFRFRFRSLSSSFRSSCLSLRRTISLLPHNHNHNRNRNLRILR